MAEEIDTISTTASAPRTRNAEELSARIRNAGGALAVNASDSDYLVAINNSLRFSITQTTSGQMVIRESQTLWWVLGFGIALAALLLLRSRS